MFQMNPDQPRQQYAELVQSRENERMALRVARASKGSTHSVQRHSAWRSFARALVHVRSLTQIARS